MPNRYTTMTSFGTNARPNEYLRYPGGRVLFSDVYQALPPEYFGESGAPRASAPPSNSTVGGVVNPHLFGNQSNRDFWQKPRDVANRPHEAMDFSSNEAGPIVEVPRSNIFASPKPSLEITGDSGTNRPHEGVDYDPTPNRPHQAMEFVSNPEGLPTGPGENLGNSPSVFGEDWWRQPEVAGIEAGATVASANSGGSIWNGEPTLSEFGNNLALGGDLNSSLDSLGFGQGYPAVEPPEAPIAAGTGIPIEPEPLNQDVGDVTWTTSEGDRRYLHDQPPEEVVDSGSSSPSGLGLTTFGVPRNDFSLGHYLDTPLANMNFGTGYPTVEGGNVLQQGAVAGGIWIDPHTGERVNLDTLPIATGGTDTTPAEGWRDNAANPESDPSTWRDNARSVGGTIPGDLTPPAGMRIIGHDTANGQPIYEDANGNRFVNPGTGTPLNPGTPSYGLPGQYGTTWNDPATARNMGGINSRTGQTFQSQESAALMDAVRGWGFGAAPFRTQADMPTEFGIGSVRMDSEGGFEQVGFGRVGQDQRLRTAATSERARVLTTASGRAQLAGRGG